MQYALAVIAAAAYVWTPSDYFGMWQLIAAVLGLGFAGWQLFRTANATERSTDLLERRLLSNDLLIMLPELHRMEDQFDAAVKSSDPDVVSNALISYSRHAHRIIGNLKSDPTLRDEKLVKALTSSAKASTAAKGELQSGTTEPIAEVVKIVREKMSAASSEVGELTARLQRGADQ